MGPLLRTAWLMWLISYYTAGYFRWFFNNKPASHNLPIFYTLINKRIPTPSKKFLAIMVGRLIMQKLGKINSSVLDPTVCIFHFTNCASLSNHSKLCFFFWKFKKNEGSGTKFENRGPIPDFQQQYFSF